MIEPSTILLAVSELDEWAEVIKELREDEGYRVLTAQSPDKACALPDDVNIDLIICEEKLGKKDGIRVLCDFRAAHPEIMRIMVKAENGSGKPSNIPKRAALYQCISRPLDPAQIGLLAKRALEARELSRRHRLLSRELKFSENSPILKGPKTLQNGVQCHNFEKLVYASEQMAELCSLAKKVAGTELPILIQGETGTGKELFARALHFKSNRTASPLLFQNCGGMSDDLLQSELFGHKRGAFTGAAGDRLGLFKAADGGTVFLDEISEVSKSFQVSLLRFLQDGEIKSLGSDKVQYSDVRILTATNIPLERLVREGKFRQDLYFKLKGFKIDIPPLRDRRDDIPVLAEFFMNKYSQDTGRRILGIATDVLDRFMHYDFPGNVRELESEIRRMVALTEEGNYITSRHLSPEIASVKTTAKTKILAATQLDGATLKQKVETLEKELVHDALQRHRWNQSETARDLGLSRVGLANKIKRYHIEQAG